MKKTVESSEVSVRASFPGAAGEAAAGNPGQSVGSDGWGATQLCAATADASPTWSPHAQTRYTCILSMISLRHMGHCLRLHAALQMLQSPRCLQGRQTTFGRLSMHTTQVFF